MTTVTDSVMRQNLRESKITKVNAPTVQAINENEQNRKITLPEIKLQLDEILKETEIKYKINESPNDFVIKVMDKKTDKVIKEIPSHEIQVLKEHLKMHMGVLFDELI